MGDLSVKRTVSDPPVKRTVIHVPVKRIVTIDRNTIEALLDTRVEMVIQLDAGNGGGYVSLTTVEQIACLLEYGEEHFAMRHFGFDDIRTYREWLALDGVPLCGGTTNQGLLCRMNVDGSRPLGADEWRALHRVGRCSYHRKR